jgi:hypothetical protein
MHLVQIPPDKVINGESPLETMWPLIVPFLQKAIDHSHDMATIEETWDDLMTKRHQLWVVIDDNKKINTAAVTMLQKYKTGLVQATIAMLGGESGNLKDILELRSELEAWAKTEGCNRIRFFARKGWAKYLPDYKLASYVMSKDI